MEIDRCNLVFFEALQLDFEAVGTRGELSEVIEAALDTLYIARIVSRVVLEVDLGTRERRAGGVGDDAGNVAKVATTALETPLLSAVFRTSSYL